MTAAAGPGRRIAVITGGSSGIGAALARRLAARGWCCVLLARREQRLRPLAREIHGEYEVCDVGDRAAVERVAAAVRQRHPAIALLVNCAGIPGRQGFLELQPERIEEVLRVNYLGAVWSLAAFLPALEAASPARVVNIVSVAGVVALPSSGPYAASKHAELAFSRAAAVDLRHRGIRVHTVNPGFVETEGFPQTRLLRNRVLRHIVVRPELVAERVLDALDTGRQEIFVPWWYRGAAVVEALAPGLVGRLAGRRDLSPA